MTKFTVKHEIDAVTRYQSHIESVKEIAQSIGANLEVVRMWIKQFEYHLFAKEFMSGAPS